jgi:hypothetical protein
VKPKKKMDKMMREEMQDLKEKGKKKPAREGFRSDVRKGKRK